MSQGPPARDLRVLMLIASVVVVVLAANVVSAAIPGLDDLLASAPVLVAFLVIGTVAVLGWSFARGRRG
jgi:hypothetical protein